MIKYRSEELYGEGYRDAAAVMAYEVFVLQNTDILETLSKGILKETEAGLKLKFLMKVMEGEFESDVYKAFLDEAFNNEEVRVNYMNDVLQIINDITGKEIKYCLWLCDSITEVKDSYESDFIDMTLTLFDGYESSDIILSDIGASGKLYGYESEPIPICKDIECDIGQNARRNHIKR